MKFMITPNLITILITIIFVIAEPTQEWQIAITLEGVHEKPEQDTTSRSEALSKTRMVPF